MKIIPKSRRIIDVVFDNFIVNGHQNSGILSCSYGFLPINEPLKELPDCFNLWDDIARETPDLIKSCQFRKRIDKMEIIEVTSENLPDHYLHRAVLILGFMAHAYARAESDFVPQQNIPEAILIPWETVCSRLDRPFAFLSYFDLVAYNWQLKEQGKDRIVENMELLYPIFDCIEERILYLTQTEMLHKSAAFVNSLVMINEAMLNGDKEVVISQLNNMTELMYKLSRISFEKITASKQRKNTMDPVVFAKTMMSFAVPIKEGIPGPSGAAFPTFHMLDIATGRSKYETRLGKDALEVRKLFPRDILNFFEALSEHNIYDYVEEMSCLRLKSAFDDFMNSYAGPDGFFAVHRKKIYGFIQTAFSVGRSETIGGFSSNGFENKEWRNVNAELESSRAERF
jgi:sulfite reductase (NADPH) flavoprotein alpha-component